MADPSQPTCRLVRPDDTYEASRVDLFLRHRCRDRRLEGHLHALLTIPPGGRAKAYAREPRDASTFSMARPSRSMARYSTGRTKARPVLHPGRHRICRQSPASRIGCPRPRRRRRPAESSSARALDAMAPSAPSRDARGTSAHIRRTRPTPALCAAGSSCTCRRCARRAGTTDSPRRGWRSSPRRPS